jgi:very-short-patch-repair endonuclease
MKEHINNLTYGASPEIFKRAKDLKRGMTPAEKILWEELRGSKLDGHKFRRQHPIGKFIADFYCHEKKLVVELDGGIHDDEDVKERDEGRTYELENFELQVIRFQNEEIFRDLSSVLNKIKFSCGARSLSEREGKSPSPQGEGFRMR